MEDELDQTIDLKAKALTNSVQVALPLAPVAQLKKNSTNAGGQFDESTRRLLRSRLIVAVVTTLFFLIAIKAASFTIDGFTWNDLLTRLTAVFALACAWTYLVNRPDASLARLRFLEIFVFGVTIVEALFVLVQEVQKRVVANLLDEVPALFAIDSFAIAIFIAIYGMYIPANWKRTLIVTSVAAIAPMGVAIAQQFLLGTSIANYPGVVAPLMTLTMAAVATKAAHVVQTVRREAAEAKQYGQYQLVKQIGEGGMGQVYQAKHRMLKRPAAIKLIHTEFASNPETVAEFEHEVQLSAALTHWNTVQVYDYGRTDDGEFYYVMEHLEGLTLQQRIRRGRLSVQETVHIIGQICDGLAEAHDKGMIHRDVKPANIFLTQVGRQSDVVKILDFGLAVMKSDMSRIKRVSGTPVYISPEQIEAGTIDSRSDIYALGLVVYECLAGQRLMIADSIGDLLEQHLNEIPALDELPETAHRFADIIHKCIQKDPENRFHNVTDLKSALQTLQ